jgi:DNA-directed RNA polymerase subunit N (RpoN/RPB10)
MLYPICPCGELLSNKQLVYEEKMKKVCEDLGVDFDMVSQGLTDKNEEYKNKRSEILNGLCRRYCCKSLMITYIDIVYHIKG